MTEALLERWPRKADWPVLDRFDASAEDGSVVLALTVPGDCPWLEGHFPDRPVLPGVVQLRWAIGAAGLLWPAMTTVTGVANLKFSAPILPPAAVELTLVRDTSRNRLGFTFRQDGQVRSQGRVNFA
jgi:3-hydroxymyristoyl/3-hydroxydecanoyl-(acyl carrier protein) dehydratase